MPLAIPDRASPAFRAWVAAFDDGPALQQGALAWVEARPPEVRELCYRFPPGSEVSIRGRKAWLVGYADAQADSGAGFLFSHVDPFADYERAIESKFFVCGSHPGAS